MSSYRNDLGAALARATALEEQLAAAQSRLAELEDLAAHADVAQLQAELANARRKLERLERSKDRTSATTKFVVDTRPTKFPLLQRWHNDANWVALCLRNARRATNPKRGAVITWFLRQVFVMPLRFVGHYFRLVHFYLWMWPMSLLLTLVVSVLILPLVLLLRVRFESGNEAKDDNGASSVGPYLFLMAFIPPLFPISIPFIIYYDLAGPSSDS